MIKLKRLAVTAAIVALVLVGAEVGSQLSIPGMPSTVSDADAIVGRPLTPVSVAGVARRSVRSCALGVYHC